MKIFKKFTFDSAHFLPNVPEGHKCKNVHGHTYHLTLFFEGNLDDHFKWVIDFGEVKNVVKPIIDSIDHKLLNEIEGLENPTCEVLAIWIWDRVKAKLPALATIKLFENPTSGVIYEGE